MPADRRAELELQDDDRSSLDASRRDRRDGTGRTLGCSPPGGGRPRGRELRPHQPTSESTPIGPNPVLEYATAKWRAEQALQRARIEKGFPATIIQPFFLPIQSDLPYNWVRVWLAAIDQTEMRELVVDAWRMVVPKRVAAEHLGDRP